jgi:hypothetical protein
MARSLNGFLPLKQKKRLNSPPIDQPWVWMTSEMLSSEALKSLSGNAHKVLARICIEHMAHAGLENGRLKVTYSDFQAYGIPKRAIPYAIKEVTAAGFARVTQPGRRVCGADKGAAAQYRLTWLSVALPGDHSPATNEWKAFVPGTKVSKPATAANVLRFERFKAKRARPCV